MWDVVWIVQIERSYDSLGLWTSQILGLFNSFLLLTRNTTLIQAFVTPLSFYYAYTLLFNWYEYTASSKDTAFKTLKFKMSSSKLTPKHAGFVHT